MYPKFRKIFDTICTNIFWNYLTHKTWNWKLNVEINTKRRQQENIQNKIKHNNKKEHFQVRESPAPLNVPTHTPAPDRGGPVACLGGPVALDRELGCLKLPFAVEKWCQFCFFLAATVSLDPQSFFIKGLTFHDFHWFTQALTGAMKELRWHLCNEKSVGFSFAMSDCHLLFGKLVRVTHQTNFLEGLLCGLLSYDTAGNKNRGWKFN